MPNPSPTLDKNLASMGLGILSSVGLGSGGRLLRHFQTPTLHWIHVCLRQVTVTQRQLDFPENSSITVTDVRCIFIRQNELTQQQRNRHTNLRKFSPQRPGVPGTPGGTNRGLPATVPGISHVAFHRVTGRQGQFRRDTQPSRGFSETLCDSFLCAFFCSLLTARHLGDRFLSSAGTRKNCSLSLCEVSRPQPSTR